MAAGKYDFKIERGETFTRTITWKDAVGNPVDITGWTARMYIKVKPGATSSLIQLTTTNAKLVLGATAGTIQINLTAAETAALTTPNKKAVYDLELVSSAGAVKKLLKGTISLLDEVTW